MLAGIEKALGLVTTDLVAGVLIPVRSGTMPRHRPVEPDLGDSIGPHCGATLDAGNCD
ncbi:MAG: hypothetical protein ACR2I1_06160 [Propionibacteriaceae bacterium]